MKIKFVKCREAIKSVVEHALEYVDHIETWTDQVINTWKKYFPNDLVLLTNDDNEIEYYQPIQKVDMPYEYDDEMGHHESVVITYEWYITINMPWWSEILCDDDRETSVTFELGRQYGEGVYCYGPKFSVSVDECDRFKITKDLSFEIDETETTIRELIQKAELALNEICEQNKRS